MPVTNVERDPDALTMRITSEFDAPVERVWQIWADPRQLEQWWGPPGAPATVVDHDLTQGARVTYYMTDPESGEYHGWWQILAVDPPHSLEFKDGFAYEGGEENDEMPTTVTQVQLVSRPDGKTTMTVNSIFPSLESMQELIEMGAEEGLVGALGQIDTVLQGASAA